jgi:CRISPR/Cas system-associated exonuclease Cas4 (RecB family)
LFTGEVERPSVMVEMFPPGESEQVLEEGITVVQSPEGLAVHISGWGAALGKKSERRLLRRRGDDAVIWQVPLDRIHEVQIAAKGVSVSSDVLAELAERGVRVTLLAEGCFGRPCPSGFVIFVDRQEIEEVALGEDLRTAVSEALAEMRALLAGQEFPARTPVRARCTECEFRNFCGDVF